MLVPKTDLLGDISRDQLLIVYRFILSLADAGPHVLRSEKDAILAYLEAEYPLEADERETLRTELPPIQETMEDFRSKLPRNLRQTFTSWTQGALHAQEGIGRESWRELPILQCPENQALIDLLLGVAPDEDLPLINEYDAAVLDVYTHGPCDGRQRRLGESMERLPGIGLSWQALHVIGRWNVSVPTVYGNIDPEDSLGYHFIGAGVPVAYTWALLTRWINSALTGGELKSAQEVYLSFHCYYIRLALSIGQNDKYYGKKRNAIAAARAKPYATAALQFGDVYSRQKSQMLGVAQIFKSHRSFKPTWFNPTRKAIKAGDYTPEY